MHKDRTTYRKTLINTYMYKETKKSIKEEINPEIIYRNKELTNTSINPERNNELINNK